jgi:hypothetical protein
LADDGHSAKIQRVTAPGPPHTGQNNAMPTWARTTIYLLGGIAAFCILLSSCWSLGSLAIQAGLGWPQLLLLPIALGLGAIVAGVLWVAGQGQMRDTGKWATIALVFAFAVFNAADNLARHGVLTGGQLMLVSVLIAVVFPVTAGLLGHIARLARSVPTRYSFGTSRTSGTSSEPKSGGIVARIKRRVGSKREGGSRTPAAASPPGAGSSPTRPVSSWWPRQERSEDGPRDGDKTTDAAAPARQSTLPYQATADRREN